MDKTGTEGKHRAETRAFTKMTDISEEEVQAAPLNILVSEPAECES